MMSNNMIWLVNIIFGLLMLTLLIFILSTRPPAVYLICQHGTCWKATSYEKNKSGIKFEYNGKVSKIFGDYTLKEQ